MLKRKYERFDNFTTILKDKKTLNNFNKALEQITLRAKQIYRANHGGGMPCPDAICRPPSPGDNL
jgi:hypothetical protein